MDATAVFVLAFCLDKRSGLVKLLVVVVVPCLGCFGMTTGEGLPTTPREMVTLVVPPEVT